MEIIHIWHRRDRTRDKRVTYCGFFEGSLDERERIIKAVAVEEVGLYKKQVCWRCLRVFSTLG